MEEKLHKDLSKHNQQEFYEVEAILDKRKFGSSWKYLIKWVGWSVNQCTWEPYENLNCNEMVEEFERQWREEHPYDNSKNFLEKRGRQRKQEDEENSSYNESEENIFKNGRIEKHSFIRKRGRPRKYPLLKKDKEDICLETLPLIHRNPFYGIYPPKRENNKADKGSGEFINLLGKELINKPIQGINYLEGNIELDTPIKIKKCKRIGDRFNLLVEWKERDDGIKPEDCFVQNTELRKKHYELLIDFYESKICFPGEKRNTV